MKGKNFHQIYLLLDIFMTESKKVVILHLGIHFKKHMFKIQGINYMSTGGKDS